IEKALDKQLQTSMRSEAGELLNTLRSANAKLKQLQNSPKLTVEQHMERRIVMLARRLQLQQLSPELADKRVPAKPPKEPGIEPEVTATKPPSAKDQAKYMKSMGAQRRNVPPQKGESSTPANDKAAKDKAAEQKKP